MRNKYLVLGFFLTIFSLMGNEVFLEGKIGYFHPTNHRFRESHSGNVIWGLELDYQIWRPLYSWIGVDYFTQGGHTDGLNDHTRADMVRINIGLELLYDQFWIQPYLGAGPQATYLKTHVDSEYLVRREWNWGIGALFKTGILFKINSFLLADLFANYSWQTVDMKRFHCKNVVTHRADISGISVGAGVGYRF